MDPSYWQRWTIDELNGGLARLLIADAQQPLESSVAEAIDTGTAATIQAAVLAVEDAPPDDLWGEERAVILAEELLEPFVKLREPIKGLPQSRPLREGDVFWVVLPVTDPETSLHDLTPAELLPSAEILGLQLVDITAAARQRAKIADHNLARFASDVPRT